MDELIRRAYIQGPLGPRGPQGPVGPKGELGPIGLKGDKGDTGPIGPRGFQGPQGVLGPKGADGVITFEDLTEEQKESLRGPLGIQGIQGEQGPAGQDGSDGADGVTPHIDSTTGNWFIGTTDTGVHALGPAGLDGSITNQLQADWNLSDNTQADYIKNKPTIPTVPTNVSSFTNDSGYLAADIDANNNSYIDLGLPSGTLWATMNVGASSETDYGNYYMYGKGIIQYSTSNTTYYGTEEPLSLFVDTARQVMGGDWRMPTKELFEELVDQCTWTFVNNNGVSGYNVSRNGNSIFFPLPGYYSSGTWHGSSGYYWSSTPMDIDRAYTLCFNDNDSKMVGWAVRSYGYTVGGVINVSNKVSKVAITGSYYDLTDKPTIPSNCVQKSSTTGLLKNDGTVDTNTYLTSHQDISGKANSADLATVAVTGSYNDLTDKPTIPVIWRGTQAQYDLLTPDSNTIYIITSAS